MNRSKSLFLFVLLFLPFFLACSKAESPATPADRSADANRDSRLSPEEQTRTPEFGGIITLLCRKDPQTMNNIIRSGGQSKRICQFLFPPLLDVEPKTNTVRPITAAGFPERSEDGLVFTWKLRQGLKWHDFEKNKAYVTTHDVKFSFGLIMNGAVDAARVRGYLGKIREIRVLDDWTFEAVYDESSFNSGYTFGREMRIMPAHLLEGVAPRDFNSHSLNRSPVGYGPFRFHHWDTGREILITRSDLNREIFPEGVRPWIDGIRWKIVADTSMEYNLFERGEVDIYNMTNDDYELKGSTEKFARIATKHAYYIPYFTYIGWNNKSLYFNDKRVRRAMTHLVRRRQILETHLSNRGKVLSGPFYYYSNEYDREIEPLRYDPDAARRLLKEAGWADSDKNGILDRTVDGELREFRFELLVRSKPLPAFSALYRALKEDLESAGIVMELRHLDWKTRKNQFMDRKFDAFDLGKVPDPLYEDYYGMWHSSQIAGRADNRVGYGNPRVDEILEKARTEFDEASRYGLMNELHAILHEDQPMTFLYSYMVNAAVNRRWRNVRIHPGRGVDFYEWWLPPEKKGPFDTIPLRRD